MTGQRCVTCFGAVGPGYRRCFTCEEHRWLAAGLLADAVVPLGYAVRGQALATDLWRYKAGDGTGAAMAANRLRTLFAGFLRVHRACVWQAAGMRGAPDRWAVVPSGRGRGGTHPLVALVEPYLVRPSVDLRVRDGRFARGRDLDADWLTVAAPVRGRDVLLIEDTWVTGGSAQSAAIALKRAGASRVALVVLGRHIARGPVTGLPECIAHVSEDIPEITQCGRRVASFW
jgi:hypothetical protein